jgi:hypothetical protein
VVTEQNHILLKSLNSFRVGLLVVRRSLCLTTKLLDADIPQGGFARIALNYT